MHPEPPRTDRASRERRKAMSRAAREGGALARALSEVELVDTQGARIARVASVVDEGHGGARIEVRRPDVIVRGQGWLLALVTLGPAPRVSYAVPSYRSAIERVVAPGGPERAP